MLTIAMGAHLPIQHSSIQALQSVAWALLEKMLMTAGQHDSIAAQTPLSTRFQSLIPMVQQLNSMAQPANQTIIKSIIPTFTISIGR